MFVDDEHVGMTLQGRSLQMWIVMRKAEMIILMAKLKDDTVIHRHLKTPKSAAVAGIVFSLLMFAIFGLLRRSIPTEPLEPGAWLAADTKTIALALNLVPFAGVAFLWFIGVLRDQLGQQEDRFFATVFFRQRPVVSGYVVCCSCGDGRGFAFGLHS